jgi:aspartyl-tRNA(Asn)/glutamyl-tRNA(Gln) amidotransferase subunit C
MHPERLSRASMSIDEKTVCKVAKLARLALPEERVAPMAAELNGIMAWIEQLNEVDIEGVEPMTSAVEGLALPMRADVVTEGGDPERVLKNAPKAEDGFFVVPMVVE